MQYSSSPTEGSDDGAVIGGVAAVVPLTVIVIALAVVIILLFVRRKQGKEKLNGQINSFYTEGKTFIKVVKMAITISSVLVPAESTQSQVVSEPQCGDMYSEPNISTHGRNRNTVPCSTSSPLSISSPLHTATESQEYAQPHVTHTSSSIETVRNPAYCSTHTNKPIETAINPAYGCTQPHVTEANTIS